MLRAVHWEFEPGDCVVVIQNYWIGKIGFVTSVNPHFIRIMLTIGVSILAQREDVALITDNVSLNSEDMENGVAIEGGVSNDKGGKPVA
jgi:hypothetical protein